MLFSISSPSDLHWNTTAITVFDSAPSPAVHRDITRLCALFGWPCPIFPPAPHQHRGSDECGLFAIGAVLLLRAGLVPPENISTVSLHSLRTLLGVSACHQQTTLQEKFLATICSIYGMSPAVTHGEHDFLCETCATFIAVADPTQRSNIIRNHLLSRQHATSANTARHIASLIATPLHPPSPVSACDLGPSAGAEPSTRCAATTQAKHGGRQCSAHAVAQHPLCRLHLLLSRSVAGTPCSSVAKNGRQCTHNAVDGLPSCAFHTRDADFDSWLVQLAGDNPTTDVAPQPLAEADPSLVAAIAAVDDPDFEEELLVAADPFGPLTAPWVFRPLQAASLLVPLPEAPSLQALRSYILQRGHAAHPLASLAWKRTTLLGHARALRSLTTPTHDTALNNRLSASPMVSAILETVDSRRRRRKWCWSTALRALAELAGALKNLPVSHGIPAVDLSASAEWLAALKGVAGMAKTERPRVPCAAVSAQVLQAIKLENRRPVRLLLALTWLCCGRTGDCRQLSPSDLSLVGRSLTVTFRHGKTIARRGPYSLHTTFPQGWLEELGITDGDVSWASELHRATVQDVLAALRRVHKDLENRSLRRGALQALAQAGTTEELLMLFSGHTQISTLRRYLAWGSIGTAKRDAMTTAAVALGGEAPPSYEISTRHLSSTQCGRDNERWLQFLGVEAPPIDALPVATPLGNPDDLPLMSKPVAASIKMDKVLDLIQPSPTAPELQQWSSAIPNELKSLAVDAFKWLHDPKVYRDLLDHPPTDSRVRRNACCRLPAADFEMQQMLQKYERAARWEDSPISMWCRIFAVPEWHKEPPRRRHIAEPLINDIFQKTPTIKFRSRAERHAIISGFGGGFAATLDLASFFDQFPLSDSVRPFFGVRYGNRRSRLQVLPMGFRPSAQVAQVLTWLLVAGLETEDIKIITYVDNILVLARSQAAVRRVRATILARAKMVGAIFNAEGIDDAPSQQFEFLGEAFSLNDPTPTASLSSKTLRKLSLLDEDSLFVGVPLTKRQLAAVVGLTLFASGSGLEHNDIYKRYHALRFYREQLSFSPSGRALHGWDEPIGPITLQARQCFVEWLKELKRNTPRPLSIARPQRGPADIIFTDACVDGWGAIHCRADGSIHVVASRWTPADHAAWNLSSSVASEPLAISRALCRLVAPATTASVIIYTDHEPLTAAVAADCAKAYSYWVLQSTLRGLATPCSIRHIPGVLNPADGFSRGDDLDASSSWREVLEGALDYHKKEDHTNDTKVDGGYGAQPEWLATARNPWRTLG